MHIKNIIISGFRSYLDQQFSEDMSPRHNVIVGRNGSGKSNFFAAIQFVIGEKFGDLRPNERQDLFHVGARRPGLSVFVEIVFDNSDGRLVIPGRAEESEVRIRRTLGLKHDEYRVNDRKFSAAEVRQLLESAGFSSANPYYIVEQGQIVNLAHMREEERYQLLKDVAGTKVYETRRRDSEAILAETNGKMVKIEESVGQLDDRLKSLEQETSELKSFQVVDRKRKVLEFSVYSSELAHAKAELERIETHLASHSHVVHQHRDEQLALEAKAREAEIQTEALATRIAELEVERKNVDKERATVASRRAIADLKRGEATGAERRNREERTSLEREEGELVKQIAKTKRDLETKKQQLAAAQSSSGRASKELETAAHRLELLQAKRGRKTQFRSAKERDSWIDDEVNRNTQVDRQNKVEVQRLSGEIGRLAAQIQTDEAQLTQKRRAVGEAENAAPTDADRKAALANREKLNERRRALWQKVSDQESQVRRAQDALDRATHSYDKAVRLDIRQGWKSLRECVEEINDDGVRRAVHGQLIDLMTFEPAYAAAIEATAGNVMFNVVVDSFDVSARILEHMNRKKKAGRVTFFPLDTCKTNPKDLPTTADVSPLISHITFDRKFRGVFSEVFGRTAVATTLDVAPGVVAEYQCDVVTMEGDQFNRKGSITGGFVDSRFSRINAVQELGKNSVRVNKEKDTLAALCQEVATVEQEITAVLQQLESFASQDTAARAAQESERLELRSLEDRIARLREQVAQAEKSRAKLEEQFAALAKTIAELRTEKSTAFTSTLSADEERELDRLQTTVGEQRAAVDSTSSALVQLSTDCQLLTDTLQHMERRVLAVQDRIKTLTRAEPQAAMVEADLTTFDRELASLDKRLSAVDKAIETALIDRKQLEEQATAARRRIVDTTMNQQDEVDTVDRALNQRSLWANKKEEAQNRIRRLGVVSGPDVEQYATHSIPKLMAALKSVNEELKKFDHVNKKALDQYTTLLDARNDLRTKREGLEKERESINQLMKHLDQQKGDAIERTYKQVQFNFEEVFRELVSAEGAVAELQLVKSAERNAADPFSGVRIRVGFGLGMPTSELSQLSGGQKSLVALSLIFAIQRCDPAPFYLFDEIDAALDAEYRTSVAKMLARQSETCQFVTATFKTELLDVADRVYGIFFQNKVSRVQAITRDEGAMLLRQAAMDEQRKRGRDE